MKSEHLDDAGGLQTAALMGITQLRRNRPLQHQPRDGQCLASLVVKERVDIGDQLSNPGVEIQAFTQACDKAAGERVAFALLVGAVQAD